MPVTGAPAGEVFSATGMVRSDVSGRTVCLVVREYTSGGSQVAAKQGCTKPTSGWTALPSVSYAVQASGDSLGVIVRQGAAVAGDSFEVDNLSLTDADTTAPTTPTGVTANGVSSSQIDISWQPSSDSDYSGVWGYAIYRDGGATPIATVAGSATTYQDTGLSAGMSHSYTVAVFDYTQNFSAPSTPATASTQASQPTALWHMDETSGSTMFDAIGSADGAIHNVQLGVAGMAGTAYGFNGSSSYVSVPSSPSVAPGSSNMSFTVDLNTGSLPTSGDYDLFRRGAYPGDFYKLELLQSGQAWCQFRGDANGGTSKGISGGPALNDNQWHTVTCAKTATQVMLTVDGTTYTATKNVGSITDTDPLIIGAHPGSDYYNGTLDEASISIG